jgi:hypothetical protein
VTDRPRVPAVGGERSVPEPDPIARDYLLLALRLGQRTPGLIDGYFGPAELKARVDLEQLRAPGRLADDAVELVGRLEAEAGEPDRRDWLRAQLVALGTHARVLAGETLPYPELVERCFARMPVARGEAAFAAEREAIEELLPGTGPLAERLAAWDERLVVPVDRLGPVVDWLVALLRERAAPLFGIPPGDSLRVSLVSGQPWSGYNWYDGALRSRVDLNVDLPIRVPDLVATLAHETYGGHHLEHAWKEAELVERRGHLEASTLLINTPECLISEGLAEVGRRFVIPPADEADLLLELISRAGLPVASDPVAAREVAALAAALRVHRSALRAADIDAALMLHADGRPVDEARAWLERVALLSPERVVKKLEFLEHPLWRTYAFVYGEGAALLDRWLAAVPADARAARYRRLLVEPLTPPRIEAELSDHRPGSMSRTNTVRSSPSPS